MVPPNADDPGGSPPADPDRRPIARGGRGGRSRGAPGGARRAADLPPGTRSGPPGEGWDDGRGHRSAGDRPAARTGGGLPRWAPFAGIGVVLLLVLVGIVVLRGGGGATDGGRCLDELLARLPNAEGADVVVGTDFVQARHAGFDDKGSLEDLGTSLADTGTLPDRLTSRYRIDRLLSVEDFTARTGVSPGDVRCALAADGRSVMDGSFDAAEVKGSDVGASGDAAATEDRLAFVEGGATDPQDLLDPAKGDGLAGDEGMAAVVRSLRADGAYSIAVERSGRKKATVQVAGLGVGGSGDHRTLVVAWAFRTADDAKAGKADVVDRVNALAEGSTTLVSRDLVVDGNLVTAMVDARRAPDLADLVDRGLLPSGS